MRTGRRFGRACCGPHEAFLSLEVRIQQFGCVRESVLLQRIELALVGRDGVIREHQMAICDACNRSMGLVEVVRQPKRGIQAGG